MIVYICVCHVYESHAFKYYCDRIQNTCINAQGTFIRDHIWKGKDNKNLQRDVPSLHFVVGQGGTIQDLGQPSIKFKGNRPV